MIKKISLTLFTAVSLFGLTLAGQALAAPQDPQAQPGKDQGVLLVQTQDNEITVAKDGEGYNIHRFSTLRLVVNAGQNDFDYFCGNTKYFVGNIKVQAGQTTTVALQPGLCEQPITTSSKADDSLSPADYQLMWSIGNFDGWNCITTPPAHPKAWSAAQQKAYDDGYANGELGWNVNNPQNQCQ
jgi:hypothetical protein